MTLNGATEASVVFDDTSKVLAMALAMAVGTEAQQKADKRWPSPLGRDT